jgi:hypothetical protein
MKLELGILLSKPTALYYSCTVLNWWSRVITAGLLVPVKNGVSTR